MEFTTAQRRNMARLLVKATIRQLGQKVNWYSLEDVTKATEAFMQCYPDQVDYCLLWAHQGL